MEDKEKKRNKEQGEWIESSYTYGTYYFNHINNHFKYELFKNTLLVFLGYYKKSRDFPRGPVVKNLPSNARSVGSIPGQATEIPHAVGQLSPRATTTEVMHLNERACMVQTTEPTHSGAHMPQIERENPHTTTKEKPARHNERSHMPQQRSHVLQLRPNTAKKKKKTNIF